MSQPHSDNLWDEGDDPLALLEDLYPKRTPGSEQHQERKCRLYLCACARRHWDRLPGVCRGLVALAEHIADGPREREPLRAALAPVAEQLMNSEGWPGDLKAARIELRLARDRAPADLVSQFGDAPWFDAAPGGSFGVDEWRGLAALVYLPFLPKTPPFGWVPRELHSVALLREVYYNPYAFVPFLNEWRTPDVLAIARRVYDAREFSGMPVLADALQEAGCDCPHILAHCRNEPVEAHARGCWVLDLALNRERDDGLFATPG